jgi:hypothetical protein
MSADTPVNPEKLDQGSLGLIYQVVADQLEKQFQQIESLNARAQQLVALGAVIFGLVVGLRPPTSHLNVTLLFLVPFAAFAALAFFGHRAWSIEDWRRDPAPDELWKGYARASEAKVRYQLIGQWIDSWDKNRRAIKTKVGRVKLTQTLLAILVACLVAMLLVLPYVNDGRDLRPFRERAPAAAPRK